ncbi:MAG: hypothetical protein JW889_08390 [Verrucomicrobia bacterium]|nr:hypothetical protein [Verrucomicrobiota bacterium]
MLSTHGMLPAAGPILANMAVPPIVTTFGFLWLILLPVIALVEGAIIVWFYKWRLGRAFWTALWINVLTGLLGAIPAEFGEFFSRAAIGGLSIWTALHLWPLVAFGLLLAYYLATFLVEAVLLYARTRRASPLNCMGKALKASALFNAATYVMIAPVWFIGMAASIHGATLVHKSRWLPEISEVFVYEEADGSLWLGTTTGERFGQIWLPQPHSQNTAFKISDDGRWLIVLTYTLAADRPPDADTDAPAVKTTTELARYDLSLLEPRLLANVRAGAASALPWRDENGHVQEHRAFNFRDGTLALSPPPWFRFHESTLTLFLNVDTTQPPARAAWPSRVELDHDGELKLTGSRGMMLPLLFVSPNVLPGGRHVLLECSGEIMVLDIEERKLVSLFRGRNPVALASFEPEKEDQPQIAIGGTD